MEIHLAPDQEARLAALAAGAGRSPDEIVREAVLKRLAGGETAIVPVMWFYEASSVLARAQKVLELLCTRNSNPRISAILSMAGRGDSLAALAPWPQ